MTALLPHAPFRRPLHFEPVMREYYAACEVLLSIRVMVKVWVRIEGRVRLPPARSCMYPTFLLINLGKDQESINVLLLNLSLIATNNLWLLVFVS